MNLASLWRRIIAEWKIKLLLGGALTALFWGGYFGLQHLERVPVTTMPVWTIDRMIPFKPGAAVIYVSQFVSMPAVIWLMVSRRQLLLCCRGLLLLIGVSFLVFYCWPTAIVRPALAPGNFPLYDLVVSTDQNRNAFPSLHAGFGVFTAGCAWQVFQGWSHRHWLVAVVWIWTAAILAATLLIKQHVFLDLVAGGLLGGASWWFAGKLPKPDTDLNLDQTNSDTE